MVQAAACGPNPTNSVRGTNLAGQVSPNGRDVYALYGQIMTEVLIALGSNLPRDVGDLASTLDTAINILNAVPGITVATQSPWYTTPAWPPGPEAGPDFQNGAALLESHLTPQEILAIIHDVEAQLGRVRRQRWEARVCDLDLLAVGDLILPDVATVKHWIEAGGDRSAPAPDQLVLPHPRLHERAFVLVPTCDIAPQWKHPVLQRTVADLLSDLSPAETSKIVRSA